MSDAMCSSEHMNKNTSVLKMAGGRGRKTASRATVTDIRDIEDLLSDAENPVQCETVGDFLKRVPCATLTLEDKNRFGDKVKRTADGILQIPFMARKHDDLVAMRVYPAPLLEWMFVKMFGEPKLAIEDVHEREVRRHETTKRQLAGVIELAPPHVKEALNVVNEWLDGEIKRIRAVESSASRTGTAPKQPGGPPPLRPI